MTDGQYSLDIIVSTLILSGLLMILVFIVTLIRYFLIKGGNLFLKINDSPPVIAQLGQTLMNALNQHNIYLPASCGGKGACGLCRVHIKQGNSDLSLLEKTHITNRQAEKGERLACMFTLQSDVAVTVPEDSINRRLYECQVVSNRLVSTFMTELTLKPVNKDKFNFQPGDYILLYAPPCSIKFKNFTLPQKYKSSWEEFQLLNLQVELSQQEQRAYSLASAPSECDSIQLLVRIATPPANLANSVPSGKVSSYIFSLKTNDVVAISGPFGNFHCIENKREIVLIGGGAGMAPLRSIVKEQLLYVKTKRKLSYWYGARNRSQLCYDEEFQSLAAKFDNFSWHVALSETAAESEWQGDVGFIHLVLLNKYLSTHSSPNDIDYYLCGPPVMSSATITMLCGLGVSRENIFFDDFEGLGNESVNCAK